MPEDMRYIRSMETTDNDNNGQGAKTMTISTIIIDTDANISNYGTFQAGTYRVEHPDYYDAAEITAADIVNDGEIRVISDDEMTERNETLAREIVDQMNDDDRADYSRSDWRDGISGMCLNGEDLDSVLDTVDELLDR